MALMPIASCISTVSRIGVVADWAVGTMSPIDSMWRSSSSESKLGVDNQIALYEKGEVVKGGMSSAQVRALLGPPTRVEPLQVVGSERWHYPTRTILF
jgi:hypothetical protein